jgi:ribosomal protein S27E
VIGVFDGQLKSFETALRCDDCGGRVILNDHATGETYCGDCGTILGQEFEQGGGFVAAEESNTNLHSSDKSYRKVETQLKKYNRSVECETMRLAKQQIRFHATGWSNAEVSAFEKILKDVLTMNNSNSFSNSRLGSGYSADLMAATITFILYKTQLRQPTNPTTICRNLLELSQQGTSPCGTFATPNDPSLKNCIKKILRHPALAKWKSEPGNKPSLQNQLIRKREELLDDMVTHLIQSKILPTGFTVPLEVKPLLSETDYPLKGNIVISCHQELIYQLARKEHKITRKELFIATEGFGGTPKFSNHESRIKEILLGCFGGGKSD